MRNNHVVRIALGIVIVLMMGSEIGLAQSNNCGRVGTWFGRADSGITWMAIDLRGVSAAAGQVELDWVMIDPTLGGFFPTVVRATAGKGVWESVNQSKLQVHMGGLWPRRCWSAGVRGTSQRLRNDGWM